MNIDLKDTAVRSAVRQLLRTVKDSHNLRWEKFASQIGFDKEDVVGVAYDKKKPWHDFVVKLVRCCNRRGYAVPSAIAAQLGLAASQPAPPAVVSPPAPLPASAPPERGFIASLGIDKDIRKTSVDNYNGTYYNFTLDDDRKVVVSAYGLSRELGADQTPIYRSWRKLPNQKKRRRYVGAYFANTDNLYLVGTPIGAVDIRLSIFSIIPGEKQNMLRGMGLVFSHRRAILTGNSILVRAQHISSLQRNALMDKPLTKDDLQKILSLSKPAMKNELLEIVDYLYDLNNPTQIKYSTNE
ncbi:hypothetical protein XI07_13790 [Bradyrhizobium sp. CCBAU 11445]|uniref:hypothetical protein n=1 Tax=Bradyrhizobium sp. CCBAU 11445 TaxID=1630896 RepID=UPI002305F4BE|nr:hypothetical protein [Bradyrhizobium sp. CCBAU 11445]MDA9483079.1 hypothetical protein [Bradyrhizobium sp. CCBAU 11445]